MVLNDAIHFIDLHNWLLDAFPVRVRAVLRDHFGRGLDDMALLEMEYPGGVMARIEAGCTLPGRWNDNIVKGATASKETTIAGAKGAVEADFVTQTMLCHEVRHELIDDLWQPVFGDVTRPHIATAEPVEVVADELGDFLRCRDGALLPEANVKSCGVQIAEITAAVFASAESLNAVDLISTVSEATS